MTNEQIEKLKELRKAGRNKLNNFFAKIFDTIINNKYENETEKISYLLILSFALFITNNLSDSECNALCSLLDEVFKKEDK